MPAPTRPQYAGPRHERRFAVHVDAARGELVEPSLIGVTLPLRHGAECRATGAAASYPGPMPRLRVAAAQLNVVVGDLDGNAARILEAYDEAEAAGCDLVVFPELTVTGYPPEDLLLRPAFVAQAAETLDKIAAAHRRGRRR